MMEGAETFGASRGMRKRDSRSPLSPRERVRVRGLMRSLDEFFPEGLG